jgi:hypothetical protein
MIAVRLLVLFALLVAPLVAEAQQAGRVYRLGMLFSTTPPSGQPEDDGDLDSAGLARARLR